MVATLDAFSGGGGGGGGSNPDATIKQRGSALAVATDAETTVVSLTVGVGFTFKLVGVIGTGSADGEWVVYDDATEVWRQRTSGAVRGLTERFPHALPFAAGHVVALKVIHQQPSVQNFHGTLLGFNA